MKVRLVCLHKGQMSAYELNFDYIIFTYILLNKKKIIFWKNTYCIWTSVLDELLWK